MGKFNKIVLLLALVAWAGRPVPANAQQLFLMGGAGGAGVSSGTGVNVTLGGSAMYRRLLASVTAADVTMVPTDQGNGRDFYREQNPNGRGRCIDARSERPVSEFQDEILCYVTDFSYAASADLSVLLPGGVFAGGGIRAGSIVAPYMALGITTQTPKQPRLTFAPFVRASVGSDFWTASAGGALRLR